MLPVTATAQQRREDRRSNDRGSDQRRSDNRSDQRKSDEGASPANPRSPWWEQQQKPWWERQGKPSWEPPTQTPAWQTMNPARTLLDRDREQRQRDQAGDGFHHGSRRNSGTNVIIVPQYRYFPFTFPGSTQFVVAPPPPAQVVTHTTPVPRPPAAGILRLDVEPRELLQLYVDGVYIGTPGDLGDDLMLIAGTRRIEIRARGYQTLAFSADIQEGRSISYRGVLERDETAAPPPAPIVVPFDLAQGKRPADTPGGTRMFMIPGCYLGNVAPKPEQLRPGCDISKLATFAP